MFPDALKSLSVGELNCCWRNYQVISLPSLQWHWVNPYPGPLGQWGSHLREHLKTPVVAVMPGWQTQNCIKVLPGGNKNCLYQLQFQLCEIYVNKYFLFCREWSTCNLFNSGSHTKPGTAALLCFLHDHSNTMNMHHQHTHILSPAHIWQLYLNCYMWLKWLWM